VDPRPENPSRPPGRSYRRRRRGEPVSQEWTAGGVPPLGNPLAGVLDETWQEYRRHAARLLPLAAAGVAAAALGTELVHLMASRFDRLVAFLLVVPAAWLLVKLVVALLGVVTVGLVHQTRAQDGVYGPVPARLRECLGEVTAVWLVATFAVLGGFLLLVIPGLYLTVIWIACVPVIVVERTGPLAALGRSRRLVRGHGWRVFGLLVALTVMESVVSTILRAALSWLPSAWQLGLASGLANIVFIPAGAVLATVIYYRLTAAEALTD
jgi:hypothetical protein